MVAQMTDDMDSEIRYLFDQLFGEGWLPGSGALAYAYRLNTGANAVVNLLMNYKS